jgi:uncharacterized HhH-GPD family protein
MTLCVAQEPEADALLSRDPFALLTGMLLDQQYPMEHAFRGPAKLARRLGVDTLDPAAIAAMDPQELTELCAATPAIHRYPAAMAGRIQAMAQHVVLHHDGQAAAVWTEASSGADLLARLRALPGWGELKAKIFTALLGKQLGVTPRGWRQAAGGYAAKGTYLSVADVVDPVSLAKVRTTKQQLKLAAKGTG